MERWIAVQIPALSESERETLSRGAASLGWGVRFVEREEEASGAEILLGVFSAIPAGVRWVATPNAGAEPYTTPGFLPEHVLLTNSAGAYGVTIAEHIIMTALELLRRRPEYLELVARRQWVRALPIRSLKDLRITLLGTGDIGQETARRLRAFGSAALLGVNRRGVSPDSVFDEVLPVSRLEEALPRSELLICSLPGTEETKNLLDAQRLSLLPRGALLINVGRGSLIDEDALCRALRDGALAGAALDVFRQEPLPPESPLWETPGLIVTPHIAGNLSLPWTVSRVIELFLENLSRYTAGQPLLRRVDIRQGY